MAARRRAGVDMDRVLSAVLRPGSTTDPGACPDADTLAAFVERGLVPDEVRRLEAHAATCARCQETLAGLVRMVPEPAASGAWLEGVRAALRLRWLVPAAAAATAVALYVSVKPSPSPPALDTMARNEVPAPTGPGAFRADSRQVPVEAAPPAAVDRPVPAVPGVEGVGGAPAEAPRRQTAARQALPPAPADLEPASIDSAPGEETSQLAMKVPGPVSEVAAEQPSASMAAPVPPATQVVEDAAARSAPAARPPAPGVVGGAAGGRTARIAEAASAGDSATRYRTGPDGLIARSTDGGRSWTVQSSGVTVDLSAASAPSATVCWAVGAAGTVLRTVDGERWAPVSFPDRVDLVSVDARDERTATVTSADGRRWVTADAGASWRPADRP